MGGALGGISYRESVVAMGKGSYPTVFIRDSAGDIKLNPGESATVRSGRFSTISCDGKNYVLHDPISLSFNGTVIPIEYKGETQRGPVFTLQGTYDGEPRVVFFTTWGGATIGPRFLEEESPEILAARADSEDVFPELSGLPAEEWLSSLVKDYDDRDNTMAPLPSGRIGLGDRDPGGEPEFDQSFMVKVVEVRVRFWSKPFYVRVDASAFGVSKEYSIGKSGAVFTVAFVDFTIYRKGVDMWIRGQDTFFHMNLFDKKMFRVPA
jgi:hypothetical protein